MRVPATLLASRAACKGAAEEASCACPGLLMIRRYAREARITLMTEPACSDTLYLASSSVTCAFAQLDTLPCAKLLRGSSVQSRSPVTHLLAGSGCSCLGALAHGSADLHASMHADGYSANAHVSRATALAPQTR